VILNVHKNFEISLANVNSKKIFTLSPVQIVKKSEQPNLQNEAIIVNVVVHSKKF
jgi:hypothetical protein